MIPSFDVPSQYFYALGCSLPTDVTPDVRYRLATVSDEATVLSTMRKAVDSGTIDPDPVVTVEMAARRLTALGSVQGVTPVCAPGVGVALVQAYSDYHTVPPTADPASDIAPFWAQVMTSPTLAEAHLELIMCVITAESDPRPVIALVKDAPPAGIGKTLDSVENLDVNPWPLPHPTELTFADWTQLFTAFPAALPPSTGPGSLHDRIAAFVRRLQAFFNVTLDAAAPDAPATEVVPVLPRPHRDPLGDFFTAYVGEPGQAGWTWGTAFDETALDGAVSAVGLDDAVSAWLKAAAVVINELYRVTATGAAPELQFTYVESLFARGFTSAADITALTAEQFTAALVGTPADDVANDIWTLAATLAPPGPPAGPTLPPFGPINSGNLVNCVPACALSPLGDIAYLQALLGLNAGGQSVGVRVGARRGPIDSLAATEANAEIAVPVLDLVNESLESLVTTGAGAVHDTDPGDADGHPADIYFRSYPRHSAPAAPGADAASYAVLASDFSAPVLPYDEPTDVNRAYLEAVGTERFDVMRAFRRDITEFVLDPAGEPADFERQVWRYPVRLPLALEVLHIGSAEYDKLYSSLPGGELLAQLYGVSDPDDEDWRVEVSRLSVLLPRLGLSYCEFRDLVASDLLPIAVTDDQVVRGQQAPHDSSELPECEPCCLADWRVTTDADSLDGDVVLAQLAVTARLWRTLRCVDGGFTFAELAAIAATLLLFDAGGAPEPDFLRRLAAFVLLRRVFDLRDVAVADLLMLWDTAHQPPAPASSWLLIEHVARTAERRYQCRHRGPEFVKLLTGNLDSLAVIAGFDPSDPAHAWYAAPQHTLRFAEQLTKIYASHFGIGELTYVCSADPHLAGDDPYPTADGVEALVDPLDDADDSGEHSLWHLRRELLEAVPEADEHVDWARVEALLVNDFGVAAATVRAFSAHFFPDVLARAGVPLTVADGTFSTSLTGSSAPMWNTPGSPFEYDTTADQLAIRLPVTDEMVLRKLTRIRPLNLDEMQAVRDLYHAPRLAIAEFGFLFDDQDAAARHLVAEADERERWNYFRTRVQLLHARTQVLCRHLAHHVQAVTGHEDDLAATEQVARRLLPTLLADENFAIGGEWESDAGTRPATVFGPMPLGGTVQALLGLVGTGLLGEFYRDGVATPVWRALHGHTELFGAVGNRWNVPLPTLLPALDATIDDDRLREAGVRNGVLIAGNNADVLGGAEGYSCVYRGLLLIEHDGSYDFWGVDPAIEDPDRPWQLDGRRWRTTLSRGQKRWVVLSHDWPDQPDCYDFSALPMRRGAWTIEIEFERRLVDIAELDDDEALRTGLRVEYRGPDTAGERCTIGREHLYVPNKDAPLDAGLAEGAVAGTAAELLHTTYYSTVRDARRSYQRAFKALLLAYRFGLSAETFADYGQSELGYLLDHGEQWAGESYYTDGAWHKHKVAFDPTLLPLRDSYLPPDADVDDRVAPPVRRRQALFDLWERLFDHRWLTGAARTAPDDPAWLLYDEASENQPDNPTQLLRHLGVDLALAPAVLAYDPGVALAASDLTDERWSIRAWHADARLRRITAAFEFADIRDAQPATWAADAPMTAGNENLSAVVRAGYLDAGRPGRYDDLRHLDDCLRVRARDHLVAYLCASDRVALPTGGFAARGADLADRLLQDVLVETGRGSTRIDDAVSAVRRYVERARLGLEPDWAPTPAFLAAWDCTYRDCATWKRAARGMLYPENRVQWSEHALARRSEGFRFLEAELAQRVLSAPSPGGDVVWEDPGLPRRPSLELLQDRAPSTLTQLSTLPEGFGLLGTPDRSGQRSWLAAIDTAQAVQPPSNGDGGDHPGEPKGEGDPLRAREVQINAEGVVPRGADGRISLWIEAAIRLGTRFLRVPAAGVPDAGNRPRARIDPVCACGRARGTHIDEYYLWLIDSRRFADVEQVADWPGWHQAVAAAPMLVWPAQPTVHLMWCHVHDGEIGQPRRSIDGVSVTGAADLILVGRSADSLLLQVTGGQLEPGTTPPPLPGFRYDLATDDGVAVPAVAPQSISSSGMGNLTAYPHFAYFTPGAPLLPVRAFSEVLAVADALRSDCRYEAALRWLARGYDPLTNDNGWCPAPTTSPSEPPPDRYGARTNETAVPSRKTGRKGRRDRDVAVPDEVRDAISGVGPRCCDGSTEIDDAAARRRYLTLQYLETLLAWIDCELRTGTPAAREHAGVLSDLAVRVLGPSPLTIEDGGGCFCSARTAVPAKNRHEGDDSPAVTVADFVPQDPGLNPWLMSLYDRVADRQSGLRAFRGDVGDRCCCAGDCGCYDTPGCDCGPAGPCCCPSSPYRFSYVHAHAGEAVAQLISFGTQLRDAFERGDAEYLNVVRGRHEDQVAQLNRDIRQQQWREAEWQVQALNITKQIAQDNLAYYQMLIANDLVAGELDYQSLTNSSLGVIEAATVSEAIGTVLGVIPDVFVGTMDFTQLPIGSKLAGVFSGTARISLDVGQILSGTAGLRLNQAGWARRAAEWQHQVDIFGLEIAQAERQILAAERHQDAALRELNSIEQQAENTRESVEFLRDKTTSHAYYLALQRELMQMYAAMYSVATCLVNQAEQAFNVDRGYTHRRFAPAVAWDNRAAALTAGERLALALREMDAAYTSENARELELEKHISLRKYFGPAFLSLKLTGKCVIELPEWLFDLDFPGHYLRRIKSVALSIPSIVGPYTGVHARLTLLQDSVRVEPRLSGPRGECCCGDERQDADCACGAPCTDNCDCGGGCDAGYELQCDDKRAVRNTVAAEIATSTGQNDTGLFELNLSDNRILPMEFRGAADSRWRLEVPPENNEFDLDTMSDVILHLRFTARDAGPVLRRAASCAAGKHLPDDGVRVIDVAREMPELWDRYRRDPAYFELALSRGHFAYLQGDAELSLSRIDLFVESRGSRPSRHRRVEFIPEPAACGCEAPETEEFGVVGGAKFCGFYHGAVDVDLGPIRGLEPTTLGRFHFPEPITDTSRLFLVVRYSAHRTVRSR